MEYPVTPFLTIILLTFATDHICCEVIIASQNPLPVGSNVTLLPNQSNQLNNGVWNFGSDPILIMINCQFKIFPEWEDRVTFNCTTAELSISSLQVSDSGLYKFAATNPSTEGEITLSVQELIFNASLSVNAAHLVEFSDSAVFRCYVSSGSSLSYLWTNASSVVTPATKGVQLSVNGSILTIANVTRYDSGPFMCQVSNALSNASSDPIQLKISYGPSRPTMVTSPKMPVHKSWSNITLTCHAESSPNATVQWFFNETELRMSGPTIQLNHSTENQTGYYKCLFHNAVTNRNISVTTLIRIVAPVSMVMVTSSGGYPITNDNFSLTCHTLGSVESIYWMKNGSVIQTTSRVMLNVDNTTLTFSPVLPSDSDYYECKASNPVSSLMSGPHALHVAYGPSTPVITGPEVAIYGENLTLSCSAESYPASSFHWKFYSKSAMGNASVSVGNTSELELSPVAMNMSGVYRCTAYNNVTHESNSTEKRLVVLAPLTHVQIEDPSTVPIQGHSFTLRCNTTGGVNHVYWMRNSEKLYPDNTTSMRNQTLTFNPLHKRDSGNYQCTAANDRSNMTSATYRLKVMYGPEVPVITGQRAALEGHQVTLNCSASSQPPSQYHWYFDSSLVANTSQYVTEPLTMNMSGKYECKAHNNITGNHTMASTTLTVYAPVSMVMVTSSGGYPITNDNFSLTCHTLGSVESIYWMKNGSVIQTTSRVMLNVDNTTLSFSPVLPSDSDYYECKASNPVSSLMSGPHALHVAFGPHTPIITGPLNAETGEDVVFTCSASSYPPSYYSWYHKDHLGQTYLLSNDSKFTTGPLRLNMSGEYTCIAMNNVTNDNSTKSTALVVVERIEHVAIKEDSLPIQSHNYTLICEVTGPYDSIYWTKNGTWLESSNSSTNYSHTNYSHSHTDYSHSHQSYYMKNNSLHFSPVTTNNDGVYRCVAVNVVRPHSSPEYKLLVNYGPLKVRIDGPETVHTSSGISVSLTCSADSRPTSQFQWFIGSGQGAMLAGPQITLSAFEPSLTCKAYNNVTGISMSKSVTFNINDAPSHSLASHGILLFMTLSALSISVLGDIFVI